MDFNDIVGQEFLFYGIDRQMFKLDEIVWGVEADSDDECRSVDAVKLVNISGTFFREPIAIVVVEKDQRKHNSGYQLVDVEDKEHIWLRFGINDLNRYSPSFYFDYTPKKSKSPKKKAHNHEIDALDRLFDPRET
jgi:hypothetical protein